MSDDGRIEIPLRMYRGNLDILLAHRIPCEAISLKIDPLVEKGVILVLHGIDHEVADPLGFKTTSEE